MKNDTQNESCKCEKYEDAIDRAQLKVLKVKKVKKVLLAVHEEYGRGRSRLVLRAKEKHL